MHLVYAPETQALVIDGVAMRISKDQSMVSQWRAWRNRSGSAEARMINWILPTAEAQNIENTPSNQFIILSLFATTANLSNAGFRLDPHSQERGMNLDFLNGAKVSEGAPWKCPADLTRGVITTNDGKATGKNIITFESVKTQNGVGTKVCLLADDQGCITVNSVPVDPKKIPELTAHIQKTACEFKNKASDLSKNTTDAAIDKALSEYASDPNRRSFARGLMIYMKHKTPVSPVTLACHLQVVDPYTPGGLTRCLDLICEGKSIRVPLQIEDDFDKNIDRFDFGSLSPELKETATQLETLRAELRRRLPASGSTLSRQNCSAALDGPAFDRECDLTLENFKGQPALERLFRNYDRFRIRYWLQTSMLRERVSNALEIANGTYACCQLAPCFKGMSKVMLNPVAPPVRSTR